MLDLANRMLRYFHERFYWDDDGLSGEDVKALVLQRERRQKQKLRSAHSLMRAEENGRPSRTTIASELTAYCGTPSHAPRGSDAAH
jgi:hypothetical protein